jgi:peptidoglycan/LPS O-acetylase OafA/YrhL
MNVQITNWFFLFIDAAFFAVDTFFLLGGFLVAYSFLREKSKNILKYPIAIVHRILRFWPSYLTTILVFYAIFIHTGSGPIWWNNQAY